MSNGVPTEQLARLADKFPESRLEWRVSHATKDESKVMVLAYLEARDVMYRLDEVCGPEHWRNEFTTGPDGGILCGLSIKVNGEWVTKWDGASNTEVEAIKGGLSGAMKRAAVQWGIGRYLYYLPQSWVPLGDSGEYSHKRKDGQYKKWNPPKLSKEFLPATSPAQS